MLNRSENYLLLGFLLVMASQSVLLLARQSVTRLKIIVLSRLLTTVKVKLNDGKNSVTLETQVTLCKSVVLGQGTIQSVDLREGRSALLK